MTIARNLVWRPSASASPEQNLTEFSRIYDAMRRTILEQDAQLQSVRSQVSDLSTKIGSGMGLSAQQQKDVAGLIGALAQPVIGSTATDPILQGVPTGNGTVTSVTVVAGTNLTGGGTVTSAGSITLNVTGAPSFTSVSVNGAKWSAGNGTPEGAVIGSIGDLFSRKDGGAVTTLYVKESGAATNTGWVAK